MSVIGLTRAPIAAPIAAPVAVPAASRPLPWPAAVARRRRQTQVSSHIRLRHESSGIAVPVYSGQK
ncbi:hypothetical protein [Streptomyces sp. 029-5]|uniref:hypothetical protein n=1 Tax=Streptomyces sp. 029-5 TaxID=2789261 RepID=UPI00397F807B